MLTDLSYLKKIFLNSKPFYSWIIFLGLFSVMPFHQRVYSSENKLPTAKIVNGKDVHKRPVSHPHPYLVSIQYKQDSGSGYQHTCGGAILDRWTIITGTAN